jgi:hypothetical protein
VRIDKERVVLVADRKVEGFAYRLMMSVGPRHGDLVIAGVAIGR